MNINISFAPEGTTQCLWTEAIPLHELGRLEVTRASNIEFNNTTQHWEVKDQKGKVRFIAKSRDCLLEIGAAEPATGLKGSEFQF